MPEITMYFSKLKTFYYTLSRTELFASNQAVQENCMILASAYSNILSLFWKVKAQNNYNYISKKLDSIIRKFDEIEKLEKIIYEFLLEKRRES